MGRVYECLTAEHDLRLVAVASALCLFAAWTGFGLAERARGIAGARRAGWIAAAAVVAGCGKWSFHFVSMLAFDPGVPAAYHLPTTGLAALVAMAPPALGFALLDGGGGRPRPWAAGAAFGVGIAAMHYAGMAAVRLPAEVGWDPGLVALSLAAGLGLATAACLTFRAGARPIVPTLLITAAVCSLHFTAMAAFEPVPTPLVEVAEPGFSRQAVAAGVAAMALLTSALGAGALLDRHLARRTIAEMERLRTLAGVAFEGIVIHDWEGLILDVVNDGPSRLAGLPRDALVGRSLLDLVRPDEREALARCLATVGVARCEADLLRPDGGSTPVELLSRPFAWQGRTVRVAALRDLSERREAELRIRHLAHHDPLTGLPNRALFAERLRHALAAAARAGGTVAVLCVDLDRFKDVNDAYGHPVGDALLRHAAAVLRAAVRAEDTVARLGGDEFAVVQTSAARPESAAGLAGRLVAALAREAALDGVTVAPGASVGVAVSSPGDRDADQLLVRADLALYRAKADGRGCHRVFEPGMDEGLKERRALEHDLREAVAQGRFAVFYQPQADARTGEILGFEALLRCPLPGQGMIPAARFVPLAEEIGLICVLGAWVLRAACAEAVGWPAGLRLGVNLSPAQFARGDLAELVGRTLLETGLPAHRLELEITEGVLLHHTEDVLAVLDRLKRLGVRIAMDDFGTGYSSLSYLHRFPFDRIKVDRSFVADLVERPEAASIVRAVVGLSDSLGVEVVAEGVETEGQLEALRREGCHEVQGFLIGRPMPAEAVLPYLAGRAGGL